MYKQYKKFIFLAATILFVSLMTYYLQFVKGLVWADWTGFGEFTDPTGQYIPAKTLWDWLELLIVPIALALGAWLLNRSDKETELRIEKQRAEAERVIADERQHQATFEGYLDRMTELLIESNLRGSEEGAEIRNIARTRTLAVLRNLDSSRRAQILQFLYESGLIFKEATIIDLKGADFSGISLFEYTGNAWDDDIGYGIDLSKINLQGVDLKNADLVAANLYEADLAHANLEKANLRKANLQGANLYEAYLSNVQLEGADLTKAWIKNAHLSGANLKGIKWADSSLARSYLSETTTMPNGELYSQDWFVRYNENLKT